MNSEQLKQVLELHAAWLVNRADGQRADLRCADLRCANLRGANLFGADLSNANVAEATLPIKIARLDFGGWSVLVTENNTTIGCQKHSNKDWLKFTPKSVAGFAAAAEAWWKQHGAAVKAVIKDIQS